MALPSLSLLPLGAPTGRRPIVTYPNSTHLRKPRASDGKEDCDCGGGGPPPAPRPQLTDREQRYLDRQIKMYLLDNYDAFVNKSPSPGDRVFDSGSGRVGTMGKGGRVVYAPGVEETPPDLSGLKVVKPGRALPPFPWA